MKGYPLSIYKMPLQKIPEGATEPCEFIDGYAEKMARIQVAYEKYYGRDFDLKNGYRDIRLNALRKVFTEQEIVLLKYHTVIMMDSTVTSLFETHFQYDLIRKIRNSMWRWGSGDRRWNKLVDAYNSMRRFNIGLPDFEVRLDYTTGCNERGYSKFSRTFLDGVFGFLIHYKGKHVMTLGFTIARDGQALINQVQLVNKKGNRFLYKFPKHYTAYLVERFCEAFDSMSVYLVNGHDLAENIRAGYQREATYYKERFDEDMARLRRNKVTEGHDRHYVARHFWEFRAYRRKVKQFEAFLMDHMTSLYRVKHESIKRLGRPIKFHGMRFHPLVTA